MRDEIGFCPKRESLFVCRAFLREVPRGERADGPYRKLFLRVHAEDQDGQLRPVLLDLLQYVQAALSRHLEVQHDQVVFTLQDLAHRFLSVSRLIDLDGLEGLRKNLPQSFSYDFMIIHDQYSKHSRSPFLQREESL